MPVAYVVAKKAVPLVPSLKSVSSRAAAVEPQAATMSSPGTASATVSGGVITAVMFVQAETGLP